MNKNTTPELVSLLSLVRLHERTTRRERKQAAKRPADGQAIPINRYRAEMQRAA